MSFADVLWNQLTGGDIFGALLGSYTNLLGGYFYLMLVALAGTMIYIKTQNFGTTVITIMLISPFVLRFVPSPVFYVITVLIALGIAIIFYRVFK